jgi:ABC-type Zn uptake system ZnuABC Zn-binding protein ZnuA
MAFFSGSNGNMGNMMNQFFLRLVQGWQIPIILGLGLFGCDAPSGDSPSGQAPESPQSELASERPTVVATLYLLCDLTQQIAAETVDLTCLMEPGQDPHTYEPTPSDRQALEKADLILYGGYGFDLGLIRVVEAAPEQITKIPLYELAVPDPLMAETHDHGDQGGSEDEHKTHDEHGDEHKTHDEHDDHGHGDDHGDDHGHEHDDHDEHEEDHHAHDESKDLVPDPHVWHEAQNGVAIVQAISEQLQPLVPDQQDFYGQQAASLISELQVLDDWIKQQTATIPDANRQLITTHDAFGYYADAYGLSVAGALSGLNMESKPSPTRIKTLVDLVTATGVPTIFAETTTNPKLIETIANNAKVAVAPQPLWVEGPGGPGTEVETYQDMLVANTCTIVVGLGGECQPEQ